MEDKFEYMNSLLSFYGSLLTDRQKEIMEDYYYENLSLAEIGENRSISRNGVYDAIRKSENILMQFEEKLHLLEKYEFRMRTYRRLLEENADVRELVNELIKEEDA